MPKVADSPTAVLIIRTISSQPIQNEETDDFIHRQYATKLTRRYSPRFMYPCSQILITVLPFVCPSPCSLIASATSVSEKLRWIMGLRLLFSTRSRRAPRSAELGDETNDSIFLLPSFESSAIRSILPITPIEVLPTATATDLPPSNESS